MLHFHTFPITFRFSSNIFYRALPCWLPTSPKPFWSATHSYSILIKISNIWHYSDLRCFYRALSPIEQNVDVEIHLVIKNFNFDTLLSLAEITEIDHMLNVAQRKYCSKKGPYPNNFSSTAIFPKIFHKREKTDKEQGVTLQVLSFLYFSYYKRKILNKIERNPWCTDGWPKCTRHLNCLTMVLVVFINQISRLLSKRWVDRWLQVIYVIHSFVVTLI